MKKLIYISILLALGLNLSAQQLGYTEHINVLERVVVDGDTILMTSLPEISIEPTSLGYII